MPTQTAEKLVIDGYDLAAEKSRYHFPDITGHGVTLNRGTAVVKVRGDMENTRYQQARASHNARMFVTTHDDDSPDLELGYPVAGSYVSCSEGVYYDAMLGCAQKLFDENMPAFRDAVASLLEHGLLLRREINTDDFLLQGENVSDVKTPQDLAELLHTATNERFPAREGWKVFICNSGTESNEAAIKLAMLVKWRKLEEKYGRRNVERLMEQLGIKKNELLESRDKTMAEPVYKDYPMFLVATVGCFHGRTLGALNLTQSKKAHQIGYQKFHYVKHIEYNKDPQALRALIDPRPLDEILDGEGGVARVLERGKIPADLCAAFCAEGFQGEGGYVPGDPAWFHGIGKAAKEFGIMLVADEVQSMGRTGKLYSWEHFDCAPDAIAMAKCAFLGLMVARGEYSRYLHSGWHSNTFGGGKLFDVNVSYATFDALLNQHSPHLGELGHLENEVVKGKYLRSLVEQLAAKHKDIIVSIQGRGVMNSLEVKRRADVCRVGWRRGLKMLGAGVAGETARIRLLHMADATTKEIEDFAKALEDVCYGVERGE
ncbi:aminotransferase class III-fold pyridoxal phosphate-dependent enzyme [bacterium]|nr:aminotransferase class III-fold pyridoxal phosphate-dependent enzyme [bacterium]